MKLHLEFDLNEHYTWDGDSINARVASMLDEEINRVIRAAVKEAVKQQAGAVQTFATKRAKEALGLALK